VANRSPSAPHQDLQILADRHRWQLVCELALSDRRVRELTALTGDAQNLVSYHLRELRDAGLVSSRRSSYDGRDTYYSVDLERCAEVLCAAGAALDPSVRLAVVPPPAPRRGRRVRTVLFLCTGNSARSQMAEALLIRRSGNALRARSAGSHPKPLHPNAVRVMAERGIDISRQKSKRLDRFAGARFDAVVTLCDKVREVCPEFAGDPPAAHWSMGDPSASGADDESTYPAFVMVADELEVRIRHLIARMAG
jgi:protein-tyrosine-phosphatase/DNA-binding transcriptional ArsR family regulator